ncbi:MAG: hypothetical protein WD904_11690 [Dehalococcoidia bacterium]
MLLLLLLAACGDDGDDPSDATAELPVAHIEARWATAEASDVTTLMSTHGWAFVGEVTGLEETLELDLVPGDDGPQATVPGKPLPAQSGPPTMPVSLFNVRVESVIAGDLEPGEMVIIRQTGGVHTQSTGELILVELEGDTLLEPGASYLFFVSPNDSGQFRTSPIARMEVAGDGSFRAVAGFAGLGAMLDIASRTRPQAEQLIAAEANAQ